MALSSRDPNGLFLKFNQFLTLLSRIKLIGVYLGKSLEEFIDLMSGETPKNYQKQAQSNSRVLSISEPLSGVRRALEVSITENDKPRIYEESIGSENKLDRYEISIFLEGGFMFKTCFFLISWALKLLGWLLWHQMKAEGKTVKWKLKFLKYQRKVHFIASMSSCMDLYFYSTRIVLHRRLGGWSNAVKTVCLVNLTLMTFDLLEVGYESLGVVMNSWWEPTEPQSLILDDFESEKPNGDDLDLKKTILHDRRFGAKEANFGRRTRKNLSNGRLKRQWSPIKISKEMKKRRNGSKAKFRTIYQKSGIKRVSGKEHQKDPNLDLQRPFEDDGGGNHSQIRFIKKTRKKAKNEKKSFPGVISPLRSDGVSNEDSVQGLTHNSSNNSSENSDLGSRGSQTKHIENRGKNHKSRQNPTTNEGSKNLSGPKNHQSRRNSSKTRKRSAIISATKKVKKAKTVKKSKNFNLNYQNNKKSTPKNESSKTKTKNKKKEGRRPRHQRTFNLINFFARNRSQGLQKKSTIISLNKGEAQSRRRVIDHEKTLRYNSINQEIDKFTRSTLPKNSKKSFQSSLCLLNNYFNILEISIMQVLIPALPNSPLVLLSLLTATQITFLLLTVIPFVFHTRFMGWAEFFGKLVRSLCMLGFFVVCLVITVTDGVKRQPVNDTLQMAGIVLIIAGVAASYVFMVLKSGLMAYKLVKEYLAKRNKNGTGTVGGEGGGERSGNGSEKILVKLREGVLFYKIKADGVEEESMREKEEKPEDRGKGNKGNSQSKLAINLGKERRDVLGDGNTKTKYRKKVRNGVRPQPGSEDEEEKDGSYGFRPSKKHPQNNYGGNIERLSTNFYKSTGLKEKLYDKRSLFSSKVKKEQTSSFKDTEGTYDASEGLDSASPLRKSKGGRKVSNFGLRVKNSWFGGKLNFGSDGQSKESMESTIGGSGSGGSGMRVEGSFEKNKDRLNLKYL